MLVLMPVIPPSVPATSAVATTMSISVVLRSNTLAYPCTINAMPAVVITASTRYVKTRSLTCFTIRAPA